MILRVYGLPTFFYQDNTCVPDSFRLCLLMLCQINNVNNSFKWQLSLSKGHQLGTNLPSQMLSSTHCAICLKIAKWAGYTVVEERLVKEAWDGLWWPIHHKMKVVAPYDSMGIWLDKIVPDGFWLFPYPMGLWVSNIWNWSLSFCRILFGNTSIIGGKSQCEVKTHKRKSIQNFSAWKYSEWSWNTSRDICKLEKIIKIFSKRTSGVKILLYRNFWNQM